MSMLRQLSQSSLATRIFRTTPTLYSIDHIVGIHLLRQYATTTTTKPKSESGKTQKSIIKLKKPKLSPKEMIIINNIPEEPKKPGTAYSLFFRDFYHEKHQINPEYKVTEIARLAGQQWYKLPEKEKNKYVERHKKSALDYKKSRQEWIESLTSKQIAEENTRRRLEFKGGKKRKVLRLIKDPRLPKKPRTPYINYVIEHIHSSEGGEKGRERIKELAYDWKNVLTPEDKKPYEEAYQKDKLRYEEEMKVYKNQI